MSYNFTIEGGKTKRLKTAGKYCDRDIVVTATGGNEDLFVDVSERKITAITHPTVTKIGQYLFYGWTGLTSVDFPSVTSIGAYCCNGCTGITSLNIPKATNIGSYALYNVSALTKVYFPEMLSIGSYAFRQCRKITRGYFPKLTSLAVYGLSRCNVLSVVDLGQISTINGNVFAEDSALKTIILRKSDAFVTLSAVNAFTSTPFASGGAGGTVYVPSSLIKDYSMAPNWSSLACTFVALEGSIYEDENWGKES